MGRKPLPTNVFDAAVDRMVKLYEDPKSRVVVSFSAGKDSTCCLEVCVIAATMTGRLPVDVMIRDEEIMFPGTYEYAERAAARPEVKMWWLVSHQPIVNIYNRREPYWWVFDPLVDESKWVRPMSDLAIEIPSMAIEHLTSKERFPPPHPDGNLYSVIGLRVQESSRRRQGLQSSMSYVVHHPTAAGALPTRPIYDWTDDDVWLAIKRYGWDYDSAYDVMHRLGLPRSLLRIAPPTMTAAGSPALALSAKAWPGWFERVAERCPGVRQVALFGRRAIQPERRAGETWSMTYQRENIEEAPDWIAPRATKVRDALLTRHRRHSSDPFPEEKPCHLCGALASWRKITGQMFNGDPFALKTNGLLPYVEPEFFRAGTGTWGGKPNW